MNKKLISLMAMLLALLMLFSACGKTAAGDTQPEETPDAVETDSPAEPEETPDAQEPEPDEDEAEDETDAEPEQTETGAPVKPAEPSQAPQTPAEPEQAGAVDLEAFFQQLTEKFEMPAMVELDNDALDVYYAGLTDIELKQVSAHMPMMSAVVSELVFVECADASDAAAVAAIFQQRIDDQVNGGAWYPDSIEGWKEAQIVTVGSYVALISFREYTQSIADEFTAFVK
jgi:type IV secretory pathway VirB10-like protein